MVNNNEAKAALKRKPAVGENEMTWLKMA